MSGIASYVIGLDGGGTKTSIQLADLSGKVLSESHGGPSNFQIIGIEESARTIIDLVETCCHSIGCNVSEIGSIVAGLTGAGRQSDQQRMAEGVRGFAQSRGIYLGDLAVESDARIALEGAFLGDPGIIVIAGTGSIVFAKDGRGKTYRAGGWGRLIGDEGSGYQIGQEALRAVARMIDGRGKKTLLARMIGSQFGLRSQDEIIKALYKDRFDLASIAPLVVQAAHKRDTAARMILETAALELVEIIRAAVGRMKTGSRQPRRPIPLAFVGSLLDSENVYSTIVRALIRKKLRNISIERPIAKPVRGALLMALVRMKNNAPTKELAAAD